MIKKTGAAGGKLGLNVNLTIAQFYPCWRNMKGNNFSSNIYRHVDDFPNLCSHSAYIYVINHAKVVGQNDKF
jgi:hypothetical protein